MGSTVGAVTDEAGQTVWTSEYTPFGGKHSTEGELARAAKFTGKDLDEDIGLYYFNARWYDQEVGRFISEDPIQDGMNWYTYASNNPLIFFDPTGLFAEQVDAVVSPNAENKKIGTLGVVEDTDSLDSLAEDFYGDSSMKEIIIQANNLDPNKPVIKPGQTLYIPNVQEIRDVHGNLKGYSYVDVAKGRTNTDLYLTHKHKEAINREGNWKNQYAQFGRVTGNAQNDVAGNLAIAAVVFMSVDAASGGAAYTAAQKMYLDISIKIYLAGQKAIDCFRNKFIPNKTIHGAKQWSERSFTLWDYYSTKYLGTTKTQADGATAYIREIAPGKYNVVIEGSKGVVTVLKNIGIKALNKLAKNYGWK